MKKHSASSANRTFLIVLCCVLAVVLAAILVITIVMDRLLGQDQRPEDTTLSSSTTEEIGNTTAIPGTTAPEVDPTTHSTEETSNTTTVPETTTPEVDPTIQTTEQIRILLIGQVANSPASWQKSEVMILCTLDTTAKTLTMTSFQRNAVVQIPGHGSGKLNTAYSIGGMKLLNQCLEENYGVQVDGNVTVNFDSLAKLVDMVGGVSVQLTQREANYLNAHGNWGITNTGGWKLKAGENTLTGEQVMGYAMMKEGNQEAERTQRQRKVIAALVEKAKGLSVTELYDFVEAGLNCVSTDMSNNEILDYVAQLVPMLTELQLIG